jgi:nitroimidazol reductase NimA-like FMN-containing flavoprotein (pyridoxamine 5'-phosphate oxidase superfamily)
MPNARTNSDTDVAELLREIEPGRCIQLLEAVSYGRLATVDAGEPVLVVTNHLVDAGDVYIRTRSDSQLARLTENGRVVKAVYEVDSAFPAGRSGWSVIARGWLTREFGETRAARLRSRLTSWAQGDRNVVLHLEVQQLTGRAVGEPSYQDRWS